MRRWICLIVLLYGFAGQGYVQAGPATDPIAVERPLSAARGERLERTAAWWQAV